MSQLHPDRPVLVLGAFDCFHDGHQQLLDYASRFGPILVGVSSDRYVHETKGVLPWETVKIRKARVLKHPGVRYAVERRTAGDVLVMLSVFDPQTWISGHDRFTVNLTDAGIDPDFIAKCGVTVVYKPRTPNVSSSAIRHEKAAGL